MLINHDLAFFLKFVCHCFYLTFYYVTCFFLIIVRKNYFRFRTAVPLWLRNKGWHVVKFSCCVLSVCNVECIYVTLVSMRLLVSHQQQSVCKPVLSGTLRAVHHMFVNLLSPNLPFDPCHCVDPAGM